MTIFVDTSAVYALMDADDRNHPNAASAWAGWLQRPVQFITTNYVLLESFALIQHHLGVQAARAFQDQVLPVMHVHWVTEELHDTATSLVLTVGQRDLSLVDCTSMELMRRLGQRTIFAFHHHFRDHGFTQLP
jgi:predicted nucleic acid-binding protein